MLCIIYKSSKLIAQNIYSIYLYTGLHKRKVFHQIIHIMSKWINLSLYKHQSICSQSASADVLDKVLDWGVRGPEFESSAGGGVGDFSRQADVYKQCNMTLVKNLVVHKIQSKLSLHIDIYICHNNVIWTQNNMVNYHKKQIIAPGVEPRLWKRPKYI